MEIEEAKLEIKSTYGTVTEFYFMLCTAIDYCLMPIYKRFEDIDRDLRHMQEMISQVPPHEKEKFNKELQMLKSHLMMYDIVLTD